MNESFEFPYIRSFSPQSRILNEFFTNTAHYPLANAGLAMLLNWKTGHVIAIEALIMLGAGLVQASSHVLWTNVTGPFRQVLENLIGPAIFSATIIAISGTGEFSIYSNHAIYWYFSFIFGILRALQIVTSGVLRDGLSVLESVFRISIFLTIYWVFEAYLDISNASLSGFLSNPAHAYLFVIIPVFGIIIGITNVMRLHTEANLARTARRLRILSEWTWGEKLSQAAVSDTSFLTLKRRQRVVLFADIRGFTQWSETHSSSEVSDMLEEFYSAAERVLSNNKYVFVKHIADEILVVFEQPDNAVLSALQIQKYVSNTLKPNGLTIGIGINKGQVMEGALGSRNRKNYDVVGAAVNIASRICSASSENEVLISTSVVSKLDPAFLIGEPKLIEVKGKSEEFHVYPVKGHDIASKKLSN